MLIRDVWQGDNTATTMTMDTNKKQLARNNWFYFFSLALLALCVVAAAALAIVFGVMSSSSSDAATPSSLPSTPTLTAGVVGQRSVVLTYQSSSSDGGYPPSPFSETLSHAWACI